MSSYPIPVPQTSPWRPRTWLATLSTLTLFTLFTHGYHPLAEDGGLYVAGVEYTLDPTLFPHYTEFVTEHLRFSLFAPILATLVRLTHLSLAWVLLLVDLVSIWLALFAARQILRRLFPTSDLAQLGGTLLFAAWWTMPVAGTSLLLMDPYVTARSLSTPLSLLAISFVLAKTISTRELLLTALCLAIAAAFHPLMAFYALAFIVIALIGRHPRSILGWSILTIITLAWAALLQALGPVEPPALQAAVITRYYWFLSQWQWFELLGLAGPPAMFALVLFWNRRNPSPRLTQLCHAGIATAAISVLTALCFAHEASATHIVARLQVLRLYLLLYAIMSMLLGAMLFDRCSIAAAQAMAPGRRNLLRALPAVVILAMASTMGTVQRLSFPRSNNIELPFRADHSPNPWVQAFLWAKRNTPPDALFALDARYVNTDGEDAQTFRATALRSALSDYSKDGGEASITPQLASQWQSGAAAQKDISLQSDVQRNVNLQPFGVTWMVLHSSAATAHNCPYDNGTIKVCKLAPE